MSYQDPNFFAGGHVRSTPISTHLHDVALAPHPTGRLLGRCGTCGWFSPSGMNEVMTYERTLKHLHEHARRSGLAVPPARVIDRTEVILLAGHARTGLLRRADVVERVEEVVPVPSVALSPLEAEQAYLEDAYAHIEGMLARAQEVQRATAGDASAEALVARSRLERSALLRRIADSDDLALLIGRLDTNHGAHYVGRAAVFDGTSQVVVSSWRAKASADYYRASVARPSGVLRRRRLVEQAGEIVQLTDEVLKAPLPPALDAETVSETEAEDLLLAALERRRGARMGDIVATIQSDQFAFISYPRGHSLFVQGGPGTGKTAVGLHRVSYLLYDGDGNGVPLDEVLVVGPSATFLDYISEVLPDLGEEGVAQATAAGLIGVEYLRSEPDTRVAEIKGRGLMSEVVRNAVWAQVTRAERAYKFGKREIAAEDINRLIDESMERPGSYLDRRDNFLAAVERLAKAEKLDPKAVRNRLRDLWPTIASKTGRAGREGMDAAIAVWQRLLTDRTLLRQAAGGVLSEQEQDLLAHHGPVPVARQDVALIDEARHAIAGTRRMYRHVVIDEIQDFTPIELRALRRRVQSSGAFTILGDMAQSTAPGAVATWGDVRRDLDIDGPATFVEMVTAYRTPAESLLLAKALFPSLEVDIAAPEAFRSGYEQPVFYSAESDEELLSLVCDAVRRWDPDEGSVGVVVPDGWDAHFLEAIAECGVDVGSTRESLTHHTTVVPASLAKGLEFDHVVVVEPSQIVRSDGVRGLRRLYVALTRTTRTLAIVHRDPLPSGLQELGEAGAAIRASDWYEDPAGRARYRWWTGSGWSNVISDEDHLPRVDREWAEAVAASWLPDPFKHSDWRFWNGTRFTDHVSPEAVR